MDAPAQVSQAMTLLFPADADLTDPKSFDIVIHCTILNDFS
jgi:hypothetical protein